MNILLVEDEPDMQKIIRLYLEREGYTVTTAATGDEGFAKVTAADFALAVLDWMLPGMSGVELCRRIRELGLPVKIILLTARTMAVDELEGLQSGADDYIRKPFEPQILLIRIRKLLQLESAVRIGGLELNPAAQQVSLDGEVLTLTRTEYELLRHFVSHPGQIFSRDLLLDRVWGMDYAGDPRTVDTHIRRLRGKIGERWIKTHVGLGYALERPS